jgi:hypothetical protein
MVAAYYGLFLFVRITYSFASSVSGIATDNIAMLMRQLF